MKIYASQSEGIHVGPGAWQQTTITQQTSHHISEVHIDPMFLIKAHSIEITTTKSGAFLLQKKG